MTTADLMWAPDHVPVSDLHTSPVQAGERVPSPPVQEPPTAGVQVPVEERAQALVDGIIAKHFAELYFPVERYGGFTYWRSVLERAAQVMTAEAGHELVELHDQDLSYRKIAETLTSAGCQLSASGAEQAIKRARAARRPST